MLPSTVASAANQFLAANPYLSGNLTNTNFTNGNFTNATNTDTAASPWVVPSHNTLSTYGDYNNIGNNFTNASSAADTNFNVGGIPDWLSTNATNNPWGHYGPSIGMTSQSPDHIVVQPTPTSQISHGNDQAPSATYTSNTNMPTATGTSAVMSSGGQTSVSSDGGEFHDAVQVQNPSLEDLFHQTYQIAMDNSINTTDPSFFSNATNLMVRPPAKEDDYDSSFATNETALILQDTPRDALPPPNVNHTTGTDLILRAPDSERSVVPYVDPRSLFTSDLNTSNARNTSYGPFSNLGKEDMNDPSGQTEAEPDWRNKAGTQSPLSVFNSTYGNVVPNAVKATVGTGNHFLGKLTGQASRMHGAAKSTFRNASTTASGWGMGMGGGDTGASRLAGKARNAVSSMLGGTKGVFLGARSHFPGNIWKRGDGQSAQSNDLVLYGAPGTTGTRSTMASRMADKLSNYIPGWGADALDNETVRSHMKGFGDKFKSVANGVGSRFGRSGASDTTNGTTDLAIYGPVSQTQMSNWTSAATGRGANNMFSKASDMFSGFGSKFKLPRGKKSGGGGSWLPENYSAAEFSDVAKAWGGGLSKAVSRLTGDEPTGRLRSWADEALVKHWTKAQTEAYENSTGGFMWDNVLLGMKSGLSNIDFKSLGEGVTVRFRGGGRAA